MYNQTVIKGLDNSGKAKVYSLSIQERYLVITFLIWPFFGFLLALKDIFSRTSQFVITVFFALYGWTFIVIPTMDGQRYADSLEYASMQPLSELWKIMTSFYSEASSLDFFEDIITYSISRITSEHHLLFTVFALVFSRYYLKSIVENYSIYNQGRNINAYLFMFFLPWIVPIFEINGFRFWTANWFFFYGAYMVLYKENRKYLLLCLFACLVHFSFATLNILLIVYLFCGNQIGTYLLIAIGSFFLSEVPIDAISNFAEGLPGGLTTKTDKYFNDQYMELVQSLQETSAWYIKIHTALLVYFFFLQFIIVYKFSKKQKFDRSFLNLFSFSLLMLAYSNITSLLPSGSRFRIVFVVFATVLMTIFYSKYYIHDKLKWFVALGVFPFMLRILISFRVGTETLNSVLFFPSPIIALLYNDRMPVKDWMF